MKAAALKVLAFCMLTAAIFSCTRENPGVEDQLTGIWKLTGKTTGNIPDSLSDCEKQSTIEFRVNNTCLLYNACTGDTIHSGWDYKYEMLNISQHLPAAYYIEQLDGTVLTIRRNDISSVGELQSTVLSYLKEPE